MPRPIVLLALLLLAPLHAGGQGLSDSADIDAYLKQTIATSKIPGVVAMVADADHVLYSGAFGSRDVANHAPIGMDSIFENSVDDEARDLVAVMMLVEKGAIALDDPISKHLPGFEHPEVFVTFDPKDKSFTKPTGEVADHDSSLADAYVGTRLRVLELHTLPRAASAQDPNASATSFLCCTIPARNGRMARTRACSAARRSGFASAARTVRPGANLQAARHERYLRSSYRREAAIVP